MSHQDRVTVAAGPQRVEGWAWAGCGIAHVELSVDGGAAWQVARLERRVDFSWQRFMLDVTLAGGSHRLLCRAVANDGAIQPPSGARNEWFAIHVDAVA